MALYTYIVTGVDEELGLECEAATDAAAFRDGVKFAAELLAERAAITDKAFQFGLLIKSADGRPIWRVVIDAPAAPSLLD